jgi:hypothetical protein
VRIPRILHQTWKDADVPREFGDWQRSWLRHNPDWEYRFWTDASARRLVAQQAEWLLPVYDAWPQEIQRVDTARYVWMLAFGGVYADLDFECLRPVDALLRDQRVVLGLEPAEHVNESAHRHGLDRIVGNAFIASVPGDPFWAHVLRLVAERATVQDPLASTGPFMLTHAVETYARRDEIAILPASALYPLTKNEAWRIQPGQAPALDGAFAVHHFVGTWWRRPVTAVRPRRSNEPHILIATPAKDARAHLPTFLANLKRLSYPHNRIAVAMLESDSTDDTYAQLQAAASSELAGFRRVVIHKVDFGFHFSGPRWAKEIQRKRREILARSRNRLVQGSLQDEDWVLWLDVDVIRYPADVIERLLAAGKDIVVPHCIGRDGRTFDLNTFSLTGEQYDEASHVVDGILQPPRGLGRRYLEEMTDRDLTRVDSVGGSMLLVRADHHRDGLIFPPYSHRLHIETEGLAVMAADMGLHCWALPQLVIEHA